jgi:hypothetical protein
LQPDDESARLIAEKTAGNAGLAPAVLDAAVVGDSWLAGDRGDTLNLLRHWIEQERVMCLCGRIATGTTPGGVPECDNPDCSWAENFERDHPAITTGAVEALRELDNLLAEANGATADDHSRVLRAWQIARQDGGSRPMTEETTG